MLVTTFASASNVATDRYDDEDNDDDDDGDNDDDEDNEYTGIEGGEEEKI